MPELSLFPVLNATLNLISIVFLVLGRVAIKGGNVEKHRRWMTCALATSAVFLASYLYYHYNVGSIKYQGEGWLKGLYLIILIPHIILATAQVPAILAAVWFAIKGQFTRHVRVVKILWPVWMYVSVTGVLVFLFLYVFPHNGG